MNRRFLKPLVALVAVVLTLVAFEAALRIFARLDDETTLDDLRERRPTPQVAGEATLGTIVRPSLSPGVVYELIPDLDVQFIRARVTTTASGFRSPAPASVERPQRTLRIVGLGDSVMFVGSPGTELEFAL